RSRRDIVAKGQQTTSTVTVGPMPRNSIGDDAASQRTAGSADERQCGEQAGGQVVDVARLLQVGGIPGEEEVRVERGHDNDDAQEPDIRMPQGVAPRNAVMPMAAIVRRRTDELQL